MKRILTVLVLILSQSSSLAGEFEKSLDHFTTLKAIGNFKVFITKGDETKVRVENSDTELSDDRIEASVKDTELSIKIKNDAFKKWDLKIYVTYTKIMDLNAKKGAWIEAIDVLGGDELELSCATDGVIKANLACETVKCSIFTSGTMRLTGTADIAEYKVSTGGFISAIAVAVKSVVAKVSTGGDISCYATEKIDLKVNTGGNIKYKYTGEKGDYKEKIIIAGDIKKYQGK